MSTRSTAAKILLALCATGVSLIAAEASLRIRLPKDIHPSPFAHRAYAEAIRQYLDTHYLSGVRSGEMDNAHPRESQ